MIDRGLGAPRDVGGGFTGAQRTNQFVNIRITGIEEMVNELYRRAAAATPAALKRAVMAAGQPIKSTYTALASRHMATGNLANSVDEKFKAYESAAVGIFGPRQTGNVGSTDEIASGNHAWLAEYGSDPRKPGSRGRRQYINVHQMVNRRMRNAGSLNNTQFENAGRGYYFLMGSMNEPSRQGGGKAGYSRDFMLGADGRSGKQHPITLKPGETIAPMPAMHLMERTIDATHSQVLSILQSSIQAELDKR
jgi:hypothetical protein